ncbi:ead/Ea22-like family protein [Salmonella enterica]|uniref:ead/Ea22-like family protein n=1 Tax=Salmonella sp. SAL04162 TaxID=3159782 RepID=UPI002A1D30D5|nr:ead/Ea22-like family protein [Salmonella enterica]
MTALNKQTLREEFQYMQDHYSDPADRDRQIIYIAAEALLDELEKAQRANVAQDDHINQQQDRIEQLEKGHKEAAKQINSWRRLAKQNIAERGKDISELEAARQRIAELEAKLETADKLQDSAFRHGLQHGFSYGQTNDQAGFEQCMAAYSQKEKSNGC